MLGELLYGVIDAIINLILTLMPGLDIRIPPIVTTVITTVFSGLGYFLPVAGLMPIITYQIVYMNARLIWALVLRIKSFIPTMGD